MKNILWSPRLHWRTRNLIKKQPILNSSKKIHIYWQKAVLESELEYISWLKKVPNHPYHMSSSNYYYELELKYALMQLQRL